MIRLFTALEVPADAADRLRTLQSGLRGARWIDPENFHITLRFIGDVPEDTACEIDEALSHIHASPFDLSLQGVGQFGNTRPHAVWAGVSDTQPLRALQARHETAMQKIGLRPEPRKYTPHVTVARLNKRSTSAGDVMHYIEQHNLFMSLPFRVTRFVLFSARSSRGGGPYIAERTYPLDEEAFAV
ncbi:MAG: RNA 2',3'-cyclic phosphodiesterase [Parvibaculaceae bacterium]